MASTEQQTLTVKLIRGTEIRRFASSSDLKWTQLSKHVGAAFDLPPAAMRNLKLTYVDDEGDVITISTDTELQEAMGLALGAKPAVLRLTVALEPVITTTDEKTTTTTTDAPAANNPTGAGTNMNTKLNLDLFGHTCEVDVGGNNPTINLPPMPNSLPPELAPFLQTIATQLPAAVAAMPEGVKKQLASGGGIDLEAFLSHGCRPQTTSFDPYCPANPHKAGAKEGVHEGVTCDKSGACPIVGNRYHLIGHNYDLCEAEFNKLDEVQKALYRVIAPPTTATGAPTANDDNNNQNQNESTTTTPPTAPNNPESIHPGVSCDRSGMCPIVGIRYNLRGKNYDLCQAEFDKLASAEKLMYDAIPPPALPPHGGRGGWGRPWGGGWGWRAGNGGGMGPGAGCGPGRFGGMGGGGGMGRGEGIGPKLAARFVRDVTIFDGTQMAPGTTFTKIWRLKNVGEVPWPPGSRMLFVGGDQMTTEMSVPLSRGTAVQPGEEVDVAVEMTAPAEHGRYLGYWRLTGPHMRRKFGQRVWCHVQVVDPKHLGMHPSEETGLEAFDETVLAEIEKKKNALAADEADPPAGEDGLTAAKDAETEEEAAAAVATVAALVASSIESMATTTTENKDKEGEAAAASKGMAAASQETKEMATDDGNVSDDGFAVVDKPDDETPMGTTVVATTTVDVTDPSVTTSDNKTKKTVTIDEKPPPTDPTRLALYQMGFAVDTFMEAVISKHGEDIEACARDLAAASEWSDLLDDLQEMGFADRELNKTLMLKNGGNVKRTVRDLVEA